MFCTFFGSGTTSRQLSCTTEALQGGHDRRGQHPHPRGVWAGGGVVYISDGSGDTSGLINHHHDGGSVFAYHTNGNHNTGKNFGAVNGDGVESITGLWSDGVTMWMVSFDAHKVFAYKLSDRSRDSGKDFTLHSDNGDPQGIWSDGVHMWVVDSADNKAYAYDISALTTPSNKLAPYTGSVLGLHTDQDRILVGDPGSNRVRTYHADTRYPQQRFDTRLNTGQGNTNLGGIWYNEDSKVLYVANNGPSKRIYAYKDGSWDSRYDIPSLLDVGRISGIWSDGEVMWIVDAQNKRVSAYHLISPGNTRVRKASEHDIALPESMESPYGAHSDGEVLWIADDKTSGDKLYAFRLSDGVRLPGKDINLWSTNQKPRGVSSEGTGRLLVVDGGDGAAFHVYGVPEMPVFDVTLGTREVREGGGTQTIPVTVSVKDASGAALTNAVEYHIGLGELSADGNVTDRASRTGDFFLPVSPNQKQNGHARYIDKIRFPVGTTQQTTQLRVEILDDDIVEGTEYFAVVVEGVGTYSPFGYVDRFEGYERVAILDNDGDPCAPILANRPLTLGGEQLSGDEVVESVSRTGTGDGQGDHRGKITSSSCRTPDHLRENTRYQAHLFQVPEEFHGTNYGRFVVHPDLDQDRCNRQGLCAESFDPYLILFRGEDIDDAELIGEYDDIDTSTGNVSAGAVIPVRGGDKIIALVTTYSQGVGYTQGTGYYPQGVGYTLRYDFANLESKLYPLPPLRPGVLWTEPVAPRAEEPADAHDGSGVAVSTEGLATWERDDKRVAGQVYLLRWVSGETPPQSADSMDAPGYGNVWVMGSECGSEDCEYQIAGFDAELHYLVQVRSVFGDGDTSWRSARYSPGASGASESTTPDEEPAVSVAPRELTVDEAGGTAVYVVSLDSQPSGTVTISVSSSDAGAATVRPTPLTFTTVNWRTPRILTVTGVDDNLDNPNDRRTATISHAASGGGYDGVAVDSVTVTVRDDDSSGVPGITLSTNALSISEDGGGGSYYVNLASRPDETVTVSVSSSNTGAVTVSPAQLQFTTDNWNQRQIVRVRAVDDAIDNPGNARVAVITHTGPGVGSATIPITVRDDEPTPSVSVSPAVLTVDEAGGAASYSVSLNQRPSGSVTISVNSSNAGAATASPSSLTFGTHNWRTPQTVTVTGVDDDIDNPNDQRTAIIGHSASGGGYGRVLVDSVTVTIRDDDSTGGGGGNDGGGGDNGGGIGDVGGGSSGGVPGITLSKYALAISENGGGGSYYVTLDSRPSGTVTVSVSSLNTGAVRVDVSSLTFTPDNWDRQQTVNVRAVDDDIDNGYGRVVVITNTVSGGGGSELVTVIVSDDD